jgi:hypothetical protein
MFSRSTDHVERGQRLKLAQFRGKPNLEGLISPWLEQVQELEDVLYALLVERWLPNAVGYQLDVLGRIVGQRRGDRDDETYRLWIAARAMVNRSSGLPEQLYAIMRKVVSATTDIELSEEPPAAFTMIIHDPIDEDVGGEIAKIIHLAKAAGVGSALDWFRGSDVFTFAPTSAEVLGDNPQGFNFGEFAATSDGRDVTWQADDGAGLQGVLDFRIPGNPLGVATGMM